MSYNLGRHHLLNYVQYIPEINVHVYSSFMINISHESITKINNKFRNDLKIMRGGCGIKFQCKSMNFYCPNLSRYDLLSLDQSFYHVKYWLRVDKLGAKVSFLYLYLATVEVIVIIDHLMINKLTLSVVLPLENVSVFGLSTKVLCSADTTGLFGKWQQGLLPLATAISR